MKKLIALSTIVFVGLSLVVISTRIFAYSSAAIVGSDGKPLNGMAPLMLLFPARSLSQKRVVRAVLTLPKISSNRSWYANWVMITGYSPTDASQQVFVQVGLIRQPKQRGALHLFFAYQRPIDGKSIHFVDLGKVAGGAHRFSISLDASNEVEAKMDGRLVEKRMHIEMNDSYAQIGPEVRAEGDTLSGSIRNPEVVAGTLRGKIIPAAVCRFDNHGVQLSPTGGDTYVATGVFDRSARSSFIGKCADFSS
ncbi:MAG: hypothetical protein ACP5O6_06665 [Candidatus Baltobacteraceae bacterium]